MRIPYDVPVAVGRQLVDLAPDVAAAILTTLEAGWAYAASYGDVNAAAGEVVMTERLRDGMRQALRDKDRPWGKTMAILPGTESRSRSDVLLPDGRTDIPIFLIEIFVVLSDHDPHAIVECKRIAGSDTHLCREYVVEGIDRFRTGKYGGNHGAGFMVGYLIGDDAAAAAAGINAYLARTARTAEQLESSEIVARPWMWRSNHARTPPATPIVLHHSFLEFSERVPSRRGRHPGSTLPPRL